MFDFLGLSSTTFLFIALCAFLTAILHGATGMAGGIVLTAILSHMLGIKQTIPLMTFALIFSHASRVYLYRKNANWQVVKTVLIFGTPTLILGSIVFGYLDPRAIAAVMAGFLILSFPVKAYARRNNIQTTPRVLAGASAIWGMLAGNVIGPGFFLAPFLFGTGMSRLTFVGTLAVIVLTMNIIKLSVFGLTDLVDKDLLILGMVIGLITIPGNWLGREILKGLSDMKHRVIIDGITVLVAVNFIYLIFV